MATATKKKPKPAPTPEIPKPNPTITVKNALRQCCDAGSSRYALSCAEFTPNGEGGFLAATDGRQCVVVSCGAKGMTERALVPCGVLPQTPPRSSGKRPREYRVERCNGKWYGEEFSKDLPSGKKILASRSVEGKFPSLEAAIPEFPKDCLAISISARLLANVAKAITSKDNCDIVTLLITKPDCAIGVVADQGIGIVMPAVQEYDTRRRQFHEKRADYMKARGK